MEIQNRSREHWPKKQEYIYGLRERFDCRIRYIGKTDHLRRRLGSHCRETKPCHRTNWIQSVLKRGGVIEIVILAKIPNWCPWQRCEQAWIRHGILEGWPLTNSTFGGEGCYLPSEETRKKMSDAKKGKPLSAAHREKCSANLVKFRGRPHTEESKAKLRALQTGRKHGKEQLLRKSRSSRTISPGTVQDVLARIAKGEGHVAIAKATGISQTSVSAIRNGKLMYLEDDERRAIRELPSASR
jgi:hypothetical protein